MDSATLLVDVVVALWIAAVLVAFIRAWRVRPTPLSAKARNRYVLAWDRIEARFIHAPQEAVREADSLVMSLLRDVNHSIEWEHLPRKAKDARKKLAADEGRGRTELLRQALLDYRTVFDGSVGQRHREAILSGHRQVA